MSANMNEAIFEIIEYWILLT